jgi:hypothetical protein
VNNGVFMKDGQPYRGMGANYFNAFLRTVLKPADTSYREGFAVLKEHQIPFVRFAACGFWPSDWGLYQTNRVLYFQLFDNIVKTAEQNNVGLIPSLFWRYETVAELVGEPHSKWGDSTSKTHAFMRRYTEEIITRYRDSRAIWAWEFANELSLAVDLPNAKSLLEKHKSMPKLGVPAPTDADIQTSPMMITTLQEFAKTVRRLDPHRAIISGNSLPRPSAWHNTAEKSWTLDTAAQLDTVLVRDNPDPLNTLCVHVYPGKDKRFSKDNPATQLEVLQVMMATAQRVKKPLFVGEFGASKELGPELERRTFTELLHDLETAKVPLSAVWVFDLTSQNKDWNITAANERAYMLKLVSEANQRLGKQR